MSIITTTKRKVTNDAVTTVITMTMRKVTNAAVDTMESTIMSITMNMAKDVAAVAAVIMSTDIITQMKCLQAGA